MLCPAASVAVEEVGCKMCATLHAQDWGRSGFSLSGEVRWGPGISCEIEESLVDGYQVWLVNDCGEQMVLLGTVAKQQDRQLSANCCDESWYSFYLGLLTAPSDAASIAIVPFRGSQLYLPSFLPITQRTIATSTTTTTIASNMSEVGLQGCLGISVSDSTPFTNPDNLDAVVQVIQGFVSSAAGDGIDADHVSEVQVALGSACIFERRRPPWRPPGTLRRLQEQLSIAFAVLLPPDLGGRLALAQAALQRMSELSMEEATTLLTQEMQHFPELANVTVVVQSLENSIFADDSVIPEPEPVRPTGLDPFIIVAIVLSSLCILVLCAIVFCRNKCGQKTPQTDTSRAETSVVPGQDSAPKGTDDFDVQDIFAGSQEYGGDLEFQMGTGDHEVMLEFDARDPPLFGAAAAIPTSACREAMPIQLAPSAPPPSSTFFASCCACESAGPAQGQMAYCESMKCGDLA